VGHDRNVARGQHQPAAGPTHSAARSKQNKLTRENQGRRVYGVDLEILDDAGICAHGCVTPGDLGHQRVLDPLIAISRKTRSADVVTRTVGSPRATWQTMDADGYVTIRDRSKDTFNASRGRGVDFQLCRGWKTSRSLTPQIADALVGHRERATEKWDEAPDLLAVKAKAGPSEADVLSILG